MFNTINTAMTGLIGYSKGLQVIGNNLTNVNTPGYKGLDQQFSSLFSQHSSQGSPGADGNNTQQTGSGLNTLGTSVNFTQGQINQTGNPLDVAINGQGFFVLRDGANTTYSRAGQFSFNAEGFLVSQGGNQRVAGLNAAGQLQDITLADMQTSPGKATTSVKFSGNLSSNAQLDVAVGNVNVYDAAGGKHTLALSFKNTNSTAAGTWTVTVRDETNTIVGTGKLQFLNGNPLGGSNSIQLMYTPPGSSAQAIKLDFSSNVTSVSNGETSSLASASIDGYALGTLRSETFDASGTLVATYSNGQTVKGASLALAMFDSVQGLTETSGNNFTSTTAGHIGTAGTGAFGTIGAGVIEGSNIDLSQQFSNLIVMQRGYQAASQVVTISNELIQTLLDMRK